MRRPPNDPGKRQILADLWVQLWQAVIVGAFALAVLDGWVPSEHLPWTRLDLGQPVGVTTAAKIADLDLPYRTTNQSRIDADTARCMQTLREAGVEVERVADIDDGGFCVIQGAVRITGGEVTPLRPEGLVMRCPLAIRYVIWERQSLRPAAEEILGSPVAGVEAGGYACRRINGSTDPSTQPSEHASGNALDIPAIRLEDGRRITVAGGWGPIRADSRAARLEREAQGALPPLFGPPLARASTPEARFLRRIRTDACDIFGTVLGPEYNSAHRDHLHLDGSHTPLCS
ncbi:extensin family protein [Brevundimonas aveniformis]|uniref:extensin-like domain-containing protein n=1 Tax=Brevundimonas aveniformis TaxID=370977 RepID=UPI0004078656|nr:extensin family protein [Brevundimonas aveniformis]